KLIPSSRTDIAIVRIIERIIVERSSNNFIAFLHQIFRMASELVFGVTIHHIERPSMPQTIDTEIQANVHVEMMNLLNSTSPDRRFKALLQPSRGSDSR